jgi:hypothetical protein
MRSLPLALAVVLSASAALAASSSTTTIPQRGTISPAINGNSQSSGGTGASGVAPAADTTIADLLSKGYTIRAAVPNGGKIIVFMQKDQSAYACEFESLTGARCGSIN